jgi:hypothetical protein
MTVVILVKLIKIVDLMNVVKSDMIIADNVSETVVILAKLIKIVDLVNDVKLVPITGDNA